MLHHVILTCATPYTGRLASLEHVSHHSALYRLYLPCYKATHADDCPCQATGVTQATSALGFTLSQPTRSTGSTAPRAGAPDPKPICLSLSRRELSRLHLRFSLSCSYNSSPGNQALAKLIANAKRRPPVASAIWQGRHEWRLLWRRQAAHASEMRWRPLTKKPQ